MPPRRSRSKRKKSPGNYAGSRRPRKDKSTPSERRISMLREEWIKLFDKMQDKDIVKKVLDAKAGGDDKNKGNSISHHRDAHKLKGGMLENDELEDMEYDEDAALLIFVCCIVVYILLFHRNLLPQIIEFVLHVLSA